MQRKTKVRDLGMVGLGYQYNSGREVSVDYVHRFQVLHAFASVTERENNLRIHTLDEDNVSLLIFQFHII